jgi:hypothetical protein
MIEVTPMQALTIDAASQETARSMHDALADFDPQLVETPPQ